MDAVTPGDPGMVPASTARTDSEEWAAYKALDGQDRRTRTGTVLLRRGLALFSDVRSVWAAAGVVAVGVAGAWSWAAAQHDSHAAAITDLALGDPKAGPPAGDNAAKWYAWIMDIDGKATAALKVAGETRQGLAGVQVDVRALIEGQGRDLCISAACIPGPATPTPADPNPAAVCRCYDDDFRPLATVALTDHAELLARVTARLEAAARKKARRR